MNRAHLLWLGSLLALLAALSLEPLGAFAIFGSDTGEYFRLTSELLTSGHLPVAGGYAGWGFAYPDFPGIFLLGATGSAGLGVNPLAALQFLVPLVSVGAVVPLFLLFRRLFPNDSVALVGAALASVMMPRMFSMAHPAPLALGDFLVVAALWMFVEGRRDRRWYVPMTIAALALIVTHHLSTYFFLVSALGGLLLLELWRPGAWSRRFPAREFAFLGAYSILVAAYWSLYATEFFGGVVTFGATGLPGHAIPAALVLGSGVAVGLAAWLVRLRRQRPIRRRAWVRLPSDRSVGRDLLVIVGAVVVGVSVLLVVDLPGTHQTTQPSAILWFAPLLLSLGLAAGSRRLLTFTRLGPFAIAWLTAIGASAIFAIFSQNPVLLPSRHAEYLLIVPGLLVAVSVGRLLARASDVHGRRVIAAGGIGLAILIAANAAIVYPPPVDLGNFQEGLTNGDAALWLWIGVGIPASNAIASDHRLSSMIFGFDGNPATWDSAAALFTGTSPSAAANALHWSEVPHPPNLAPIHAVAIDGTMRTTGVALDPSAIAAPMSASAVAWFQAPPFVPVYENGPETAYWVAGPVGTTL